MLRNKILYLEKLTRVEGLFKRNSYSVSSVFTLRKVNIEVRPDLGRMTRNPHSVSQVITHTFYTSTYIVSADLLQIVSFLWRKKTLKPWSRKCKIFRGSNLKMCVSVLTCRNPPVQQCRTEPAWRCLPPREHPQCSYRTRWEHIPLGVYPERNWAELPSFPLLHLQPTLA